MTDPTSAFAKMVPGFDFLQGLVKNAGAALPGVGQWIAPTLDPEELDKRISELRTVQYWLEQNARLLGASIQALEVQRMTLSTLKTMNVSMSDLTESLKIRVPTPAPAEPPPAPAPKPFFAPPAPAAEAPAPAPAPAHAEPAASASPAGVVDPMQWWGALTQQFTELASKALQDSNTDAARNLAGTMVKQGLEAASESLKSAAAMPMNVAQQAANAARKLATGSAAATAQPAAAKKAPARRAGSAARPATARKAPKKAG